MQFFPRNQRSREGSNSHRFWNEEIEVFPEFLESDRVCLGVLMRKIGVNWFESLKLAAIVQIEEFRTDSPAPSTEKAIRQTFQILFEQVTDLNLDDAEILMQPVLNGHEVSILGCSRTETRYRSSDFYKSFAVRILVCCTLEESTPCFLHIAVYSSFRTCFSPKVLK